VRAADMTIEDDIAFLERIPSFALLGRPALRILAMGAESRSLQSGEILFHAGEKADGGFIVQQGSLALTPDASGNRAQEVVVGPATLLGELSLLVESVRPLTATAVERTSVVRISRSLFLKMLEGFPDAARRLRDYISTRSDQATRELAEVRVNLDPSGPGR
jgi:CRP-like cAMP-binding protein